MISDIFFSEVNSEKVSSLRMYFFIFSISLSILTFFILKKTWISSRYANPLLFSGGFLSELETNYNESNKTKMKQTIISISFILLICICFLVDQASYSGLRAISSSHTFQKFIRGGCWLYNFFTLTWHFKQLLGN